MWPRWAIAIAAKSRTGLLMGRELKPPIESRAQLAGAHAVLGSHIDKNTVGTFVGSLGKYLYRSVAIAPRR
jgi:hypothetical protein